MTALDEFLNINSNNSKSPEASPASISSKLGLKN
jgi:hypothetical protein